MATGSACAATKGAATNKLIAARGGWLVQDNVFREKSKLFAKSQDFLGLVKTFNGRDGAFWAI